MFSITTKKRNPFISTILLLSKFDFELYHNNYECQQKQHCACCFLVVSGCCCSRVDHFPFNLSKGEISIFSILGHEKPQKAYALWGSGCTVDYRCDNNTLAKLFDFKRRSNAVSRLHKRFKIFCVNHLRQDIPYSSSFSWTC